MTKKNTKLKQMEYDIGYACTQLDEVFAIAQLLRNYVENENNDLLNKWTIRKGLEGLISLAIDVQCNLERSIENGK